MQEAKYLHHCLFCREASNLLVENYLHVHAMMPELRDPPTEEIRTVNIIIAERLDAVSIEPWLRRKKRRHALTAKLLLVAYLAECDGQHASFFRRDAGSFFTLLIAGLIGGVGLFRGGYQKVRHGLV